MASEEKGEKVAEVFVGVSFDPSSIPQMQQDIKQKMTAAAANIPSIPVKMKPVMTPASTQEAMRQVGAQSHRPYVASRRDLDFDAAIGGSGKAKMSREEEKALRKAREQEKREGMATEKAMRREHAQEEKKKQQALLQEEKRQKADILSSVDKNLKERIASEKRAIVEQEKLRAEAAQRAMAKRQYFMGSMAGGMPMYGKSLGSDISNAFGDVAKMASMAGSAALSLGKAFLSPWLLLFSTAKAALPFLIGGATALVGAGIGGMWKAGNYEQLQARVQGMTGNKRDTRRYMEMGEYIQSKLPQFGNEDATEAMAMAGNSGLKGKNVALALTNAAAIMQTSMTRVGYMLTSGRAHMLRRYGITVGSEGGDKTVSYNDQAGKKVKLFAQDMKEQQMNMVAAINAKFAGAAIAASKTLTGVWAGVKNLVGDSLRIFGTGLLPIGKAIGTMVSNKLNEWIASGKLQEFGEKVGLWLAQAIANLIGIIKTLPYAWEEIKRVFHESPGKFRTFIADALKTGASVLGEIIMAAIKETWNFWKGVGTLLGETIGMSILKSLSDSGYAVDAYQNLRTRRMNEGKSIIEESLMKQGADFNKIRPNDQVGNLEAAWEIVRKKFPMLGNTSLRDFQSGNMSTGVKNALSNMGTDQRIGETMANMAGAPERLFEVAKSALERGMKEWAASAEESGMNVDMIEGLRLKFSGEALAYIMSFFPKKEGAGGAGNNEDTGIEGGKIQTGSFSDYIKRLQEDLYQKEVVKTLGQIEQNTRPQDPVGAFGGG